MKEDAGTVASYNPAMLSALRRSPVMFNPLVVGFIVFAVVLAGALAGWVIKQLLPKHHLTEETKNVVSVSMAVVATVSALVLGLLISNANTKFSVFEGEVTALSAEILRLDQILRRYGPDTNVARETLRQYAEQKTADLFPNDPGNIRLGNPSTYDLLQRLEDLLLALKPATPRDQWWLGQATNLAAKIGDTRWLLAQQTGEGTPKAFVALLVFWLALLFASFGLFAPHNLTSAAILTLCALAVAGAVGMFLELEQSFGRLVHISPQPMHQAIAVLKTQSGSIEP
jgi:CDP-diglyceride synthetase